ITGGDPRWFDTDVYLNGKRVPIFYRDTSGFVALLYEGWSAEAVRIADEVPYRSKLYRPKYPLDAVNARGLMEYHIQKNTPLLLKPFARTDLSARWEAARHSFFEPE